MNWLTTVDLLARVGKRKNPGCLTPAAWEKMRAPKGEQVSQTGGVSLRHKNMCPPELGGYMGSSCMLEARK